MPNWVNNTITNNGAAQIAAAMAGKQLVITRVAVGKGVATSNIAQLTALVTNVMNLTPVPPQVSANNLQNGEVVVMATLDSANVPSGFNPFNLTEMAVFAKSGGGAEQMIAYLQASSPYDSIALGSGSNRLQINEQIPIVVGVGASVSITVQAGNPVYVPPVVAGAGIVVQAPTNAQGQVIQYIVSTPTITNSTTLFVANGNNNVAPNFSSIQNAMNYLGGFSIPSSVNIGINVAAGTYTQTTTTYLNHINGSQIYISGPANPNVVATGVSVTGGSAGNWTLTITGVSSLANIAAGNWVNIWYASGIANGAETIVTGFCRVVTAVGTTITVINPYRTTIPSLVGINNIQMFPITAFILCTQGTAGCTGILIGTNGVNTISNIGIIPNVIPTANTYAHGFQILGPAALINCCAYAFQNNTGQCTGIWIAYASVTLIRCSSTQCNHGLVSAANASVSLYWGAWVHNTSMGMYMESAGIISVDPDAVSGGAVVWVGGNGGNGILCNNGSYILIQANYVAGALQVGNVYNMFNSGYGIQYSNLSKSASSTTNCVMNFLSNGGDIYVGGLSVSGVVRAGSANYNQTVGVLTAGGVIN